MKKVQMGIFILAMITSIAYLIFTLGFSTNYAIMQGYLGQFYIDAQEANKQIFDLGLWIVVLVGICFLLNTHKNKRFFISNYIFSIAAALLMIVTGIITYQHMVSLKADFDAIDKTLLNILLPVINGGEVTTENLDQGMFLSFVLFFQSLAILFITGYKVKKDIARVKAKKSINTEVVL
jgi:hypothetical protein